VFDRRRKPAAAGAALGWLLAGAAAALLGACGGSDGAGGLPLPAVGASAASAAPPASAPAGAPAVTLSAAAQVGAKMFFDQRLSGSGKMSCATCHSPDHAYGPPNDLAVQFGGPGLTLAGTRAVPSLRYKEFTEPYSDLAPNPDGASPPGPGGGFTWDGRVDSLADQSAIPLLAVNEMANASAADVVAKLQAGPYTDLFTQAFGATAFDDPAKAFADAQLALQRYQLEDPDFHPYTSKFDLYRTNKGNYMTAQEVRGLKLFNDAEKGNCIACHLSGNANGGSMSPFTDYSFEAVAPPRNMRIPANADPGAYDLGLCQAASTGHSPTATPRYCGMFKTPTLRNVATRSVFFHNGVFHSLRDVVEFYNKRDTNPELFYPKAADGSIAIYDDLPARYQANIDPTLPLVRERGAAPAMTEAEVDDLVAFLGTLTDGFQRPQAGH
jgi:cytochrome c peroxidase